MLSVTSVDASAAYDEVNEKLPGDTQFPVVAEIEASGHNGRIGIYLSEIESVMEAAAGLVHVLQKMEISPEIFLTNKNDMIRDFAKKLVNISKEEEAKHEK